MLIAVAANGANSNATVPENYEESSHLLIVETDKNAIITVYTRKDEEGLYFANKTIQHDCEAIACGQMQKEGFEKIAAASVTRYYASGLPVLEAARGALDNVLPLIVDYEGGTGCDESGHSEGREANCAQHQHELEEE